MLVQKYAHESNKKATLRPLLKLYNYLCGPALQLKLDSELFTQKKKVEGSLSEIMLSVHAPPSTTEKVMHVYLSSDSADCILIDFRLLRLSQTTPLSFGRHKFLHCCIEIIRQHNHFNHSPGNNVGSPFDSYPFRCDLVSPPFQFFIEFYMLVQFLTFRLYLFDVKQLMVS